MSDIVVKVKNMSDNPLPKYETDFSAGMDIRANEETIISPQSKDMVKTGLFLEIPAGFEIQVRPRSGLAYKEGVTVLNSPGTIDADYRGEIGVILYNGTPGAFRVQKGDRIAQIVLKRVDQIAWKEVNELSETSRGAGGFGSTGKN